jgi:NADH dehydrogenase FAD-containing subunit
MQAKLSLDLTECYVISLEIISQVAERQGKYIAKALNKLAKEGEGHAGAHRTPADPFVYRHLGSMATVGRYKALVDVRESNVSLKNKDHVTHLVVFLASHTGRIRDLLIILLEF